MFWYALPLYDDPQDSDDWRFIDDRKIAVMFMRILGIRAEDIKICLKSDVKE